MNNVFTIYQYLKLSLFLESRFGISLDTCNSPIFLFHHCFSFSIFETVHKHALLTENMSHIWKSNGCFFLMFF